MKEILLQDDIELVESRLKQFETNTACELLLVVAKASDEYPAAAFRFGIFTSFVLTFVFSLFFEFHHAYFWPLLTLAASLVMIRIGNFPWAKKFTLADIEINKETFEKAVENFHKLGTSKVGHKVTAMIMVSVLEKRIVVLVDEKLKTQISQEELDELIVIMQKHFKEGHMAMGLIKSIESLEQKILKDFGGKVSDVNPAELDDKIHFL